MRRVKFFIEICVKGKKRGGLLYNITWGGGWMGIRIAGRRPCIAPQITWGSSTSVTTTTIWWAVISCIKWYDW